MQKMQVLQVMQGQWAKVLESFAILWNSELKADKEPLESEVMQVRQAHLWVELRVIFLEAIYEEWESKKAVGVFIMLGRKWPQS